MKVCKHGMSNGCAYCHGREWVDINGRINGNVVTARPRVARGALTHGAWRRSFNPIPRSLARWTMNQYGGN
jgi:hypothetical protein